MAVNGLKADKVSFPRRTSNLIPPNKGINFSSDVQSDIIVNVDGVTFSLHKFPLMTKSGRIRRLVGNELKEGDPIVSSHPVIEFSNFPGGPDTFELAAKFCYGINFDITTAKVAFLRCAAEFLEMNDNYGEDNLVARTEAFLIEVVFQNLDKSVEVLHSCEPILPLAEEVKMVNRCIDVIASKLCSDQQKLCSLLQMEGNHSGRWNNGPMPTDEQENNNPPTSNWAGEGDATPPVLPSVTIKARVEWWAEYLLPLRIDLYHRVFAAMKASSIRIESLAGSLMHYTQASLRNVGSRSNGPSGMISSSTTTAIHYKTRHHLDITFGNSQKLIHQHEQRSLLETIVSLLPTEQKMFPTSFLLSLLRSAIALDTTVACRLDLERRIGVQFEQATVDDLLIPALSPIAGDTMFDVDVVQRVLLSYLQQQEDKVKREQHFSLNTTGSDCEDSFNSPNSQLGIVKVAKVIDMYLAEIAADPNLTASKFASLAGQLPGYARVIDDGLYRAIDIFLKAHSTLSDLERRKICKTLDCQKLSKEACIHAAQNERLPVQDNGDTFKNRNPFRETGMVSPSLNTFSSIRRENRDLKEEVARLQLRVAELQKENMALKQETEKSMGVNGNSSRFFSSVSRRLGKMNPFSSKPKEALKQSVETHLPPRQRRHSVS